MLTGTILVVLFTPLFYVLVEKTFGKRKRDRSGTGHPTSLPEGAKTV
jgi:hypothetical protein